jgi:hypothetical protein
MEASISEYVNLRKTSPVRPVDWRWRRANALFDNKKQPDRFNDDKFVQAAWKFARLLNKVENSWEYCIKCLPNEALADAYELYTQPEAKIMRWELEARILARTDIVTITEISGLSAKCIKWYESLFFNVSDRLDNSSWIMNFAIGKGAFFGASERDLDVLWKVYAYLYGPSKLEWLINNRADAEINIWASEEISSNLLRKNLHSSKIVAPNSWNQLQLLQLHQKEQEIASESSSYKSTADNGNILNYVMNAMSTVVTTGSNANNKNTLSWVGQDVNAAEPRADEAMMIANGDTTILESLVGTTLPEAKADGDTRA